jgi:hypothetical protein
MFEKKDFRVIWMMLAFFPGICGGKALEKSTLFP